MAAPYAALPPELTTRVVEEYLETLDDAAFGGATKVVPKYNSPVDPAARWTGAAWAELSPVRREGHRIEKCAKNLPLPKMCLPFFRDSPNICAWCQ